MTVLGMAAGACGIGFLAVFIWSSHNQADNFGAFLVALLLAVLAFGFALANIFL